MADKTDPAQLRPYLDAGMQLVPLHNHDHFDVHKGKRRERGKSPVHPNWTKRAYRSADQVDHMRGGDNVGVRLKASELVVDVDPRNFPLDPATNQRQTLQSRDNPFRRLCEDARLDPSAFPTVVTGSGGLHVYMAKPADLSTRDSLPAYEGVEFKTLGRQVVAAGSVHPLTKRAYEWDVLGPELDALGLEPAPAALLHLIARPAGATATGGGEHDQEELAAMLAHLDPEDFRDQDRWFTLMQACHHATAGDGRQEFVDWSTGDPLYADDGGLIGRRWDSLHVGGDGARVTYRTLHKFLRDAGAGDAVPRPSAADDFDAVSPDEVPPEAAEDPPLSAEQATLRRLNSRYMTVTKDGGYAVGRIDLNPELGHREVNFFREDAIRKDLDRRTIMVEEGGKVKPVGIGTFWLRHPDRRHYRHVTWTPEPGFGRKDTLNLFQGFSVKPDASQDWEPFRRLILDVICSGVEAHYDYVTRWVAKMVKAPHEAAGVVLNLPGSKGTGKGSLGRAICGLVDPHSVHVLRSEQVTGKFNNHLANAVAMFVDEAFWSGDVAAQNTLKGLITEPTFLCERKGVDAFPVMNRLHIVQATNEEWSAPADVTDRRWAVFSPSDEAAAQFKREFGFGSVLFGLGRVQPRILSGWLAHLLTVDVDGWRADEHIPKTEALRKQFLHTSRRDLMTGWWETVLQEGGPGLERVAGWPDSDGAVGPVMKTRMEDHLEGHVRRLPYRAKVPSKAAIAQWLRTSFGYDVDANVGTGTQRRKGWRLPPLAKARRDFEAMVGMAPGEIEWPEFETSLEAMEA